MNFVEELREMDRVMRAFNGCCEPLAPTVVYRNRPVAQAPKSIDMVLHCPKCGLQHIDAPDHPYYGGMLTVDGFTPRWDNPPHRTHLCAGCGHKWRPADVPTNGVPAVQTKGKDDSPVVAPTYCSSQATKCASCGERKHTPLRIDAMGGYVCLTCIDRKLGGLLGEFGYPFMQVAALARLSDERDKPHASFVEGYGYVDSRAVRAVEDAVAKINGTTMMDGEP